MGSNAEVKVLRLMSCMASQQVDHQIGPPTSRGGSQAMVDFILSKIGSNRF
jgi:hypothetical protein